MKTLLFEVNRGWVWSFLCFTRLFTNFRIIRRYSFRLRFIFRIPFWGLAWFILWFWRNWMKIWLNRLFKFWCCRSWTLTSFWSWRSDSLITTTKWSLNFLNVLPHIFFDFNLVNLLSFWRFLRCIIGIDFNLLNDSDFFLNIQISRRSCSSVLKSYLFFFNLLLFLVSSISLQLWFLLVHLNQILLEKDLLLLCHSWRKRSSFPFNQKFILILLICRCLSLN